MGLVTDQMISYYEMVMLEEIQPNLIGTQIIAQAGTIPKGTQIVPRDELQALQGRAKLGKKGQPIPREVGEITRKATVIPEIAHGFTLHRKDLEAAQGGNVALPDTAARMSSRLVMERLEDLIFNGNATLGIKGIFADANDTFTVDNDYEWNTSQGQPYNDIVDAFGQLESSGQYTGKKLILSPKAYRAAYKTNINGISYMNQIANLFPGGQKDIFKAPLTADQGTTIIPEDGGLLCDFGNGIAERYVEEDINLQQDFAMDENNLFPFNVVTYQSLDIHRVEAFLKLDNLIAAEEEP
jgi:uncharacterized linocin/CFP29 family protein